MQQLIDDNVTIVVKAVIGIATTLVLFGLSRLQIKVNTWIDKQKVVKDRELLHKIASEGFAIAEQTLIGSNTKFSAAFSYTSEMLVKNGVKISPDEMRAAVEKAVLDYNAKTKLPQPVDYKKSS